MKTDNLSILTWNIFMRPTLLFKDGQLERAKAIVDQLKNHNYDLIVFQEAFVKKARTIILEGLKDVYPFQIGPGKNGIFKTNSGVWILSKYNFSLTDWVKFKKCKVGDCFSKKGAFFIEFRKNMVSFQLVGAHLQAEDGEKFQLVRESQMKRIKLNLLDKYYKKETPQILAGDLNTDKQDNKAYQNMLSILSMKDGNLTKSTHSFTWGGRDNDLFEKDKNRQPQILDYILLARNMKHLKSTNQKVKILKQKWNNSQYDLSDHYAVETIINY